VVVAALVVTTEKPKEIDDPSGVVAVDVEVDGGRDDFDVTTAEKAELVFEE